MCHWYDLVTDVTTYVYHFPITCFSDSDDEVTIKRRPHCRKALRDSDSEEEEHGAGMVDALILSASSGEDVHPGEEEEEEDKRVKKGEVKSKRISRAPVDSDESEPEKESKEDTLKMALKKKGKKREKSQRHKAKKEKHSKAVELLKKKEKAEVSQQYEMLVKLNSSIPTQLFVQLIQHISLLRAH